MRILLIAHSFTPAANPRSLRWTEIARYWAANGHSVDVVCAWMPGAARNESSDNLNVYRVGGALFERLRGWLSGKGGATNARVVAKPAPTRKSGLRRLIKWLHDRTWKQVYWPDYAVPWFFAARAQVRRCLSNERYDAVVSVSLPFTGHLVGWWAKRRSPGSRWIIDAGDPFCYMDETPPNNLALYRRLNHSTERRVFADADAVSVTTDGTRDRYAQLFPESAAKIAVIPPLLSRQAGTESENVFPKDDTIRIVFIGTLYRNIRSPAFLLSLFERLSRDANAPRTELHFFGELLDCEELFVPYRALLGERIFQHGRVTPTTARCAMAGADVLANIGNLTSYQLPSKVVEYTSTGKRILNIALHRDDASARFLVDYPYVLTIAQDDADADYASFARFVATKTDASVAVAQTWTRRFEVETIAPQYARLLASTV
ncbi:MAG TPA: glycosyltransferase [Burkholderiales bacterium]|nr:glycosyltransferase [Burkholderiales bacterium]